MPFKQISASEGRAAGPQSNTEKENHRGHRGHAKKANHREHGEKQATEDTEVGKEGTETLVRTLGKVRLQGERWVRRARKKQTTENTGKENHRGHRGHGENKTQRERAATKQAWRLGSGRQLARVAA